MFGISRQDWQDLVLSVNVHRKSRRLRPVQVSRLIRVALANASEDEVAHALGFKDASMLRKLGKLASLPEDIQSWIEWGARDGHLNMSAATELQRLPDDAITREACVLAIAHQMTRDEARQIVQIFERTRAPIAECVERALATRPKIEHSELILGSLRTAQSQSVVAKLGNDKAAKAVRLAMARRVPEVIPKSLRLNDGRFSLLLDRDAAIALRQAIAPATVEAFITDLAENVA